MASTEVLENEALENEVRYRKLGFWSVIVAITLVCGSASAHHSLAMFDMDKDVTLTGEVKEFQWTNPDVWLQPPNESGKRVEWSIEMRSLTVLSRTGWKKTSFKPGEKVTVVVHPMRNGTPGGTLVSAVDLNGNRIGGTYADPKSK